MPCTLVVFPRESPDRRASADGSPVYRPRTPEASPLWQLVAQHAPAFLDVYDDRYAPRYGPLRAVVPRALEGFYRCGDSLVDRRRTSEFIGGSSWREPWICGPGSGPTWARATASRGNNLLDREARPVIGTPT
jgi:hypothetical protein